MNPAELCCNFGTKALLVLDNYLVLALLAESADASDLSTGLRPNIADPEGLVGLDTNQLAVTTCECSLKDRTNTVRR